jgi:hypothetical protein
VENIVAPDFSKGVAADLVPDGGILPGKVGDEEVIPVHSLAWSTG